MALGQLSLCGTGQSWACPQLVPLSQANAGLSAWLQARAAQAGQAAVVRAAQAGQGRFTGLCLQVVTAELSPVCLLPSHHQEQRASSPQHLDKCLVGEEWAQRGNEDQQRREGDGRVTGKLTGQGELSGLPALLVSCEMS